MNPIREAMANIRGNFLKRSLGTPEGPKCGVGHLRYVLGDVHLSQGWVHDPSKIALIDLPLLLLNNVSAEQFPERGNYYVEFNDHPATTEDDVLTVFDKAAVLLDEQQDLTTN